MEKIIDFYIKHLKKHNLVLSGSTALILQGIMPPREIHDIDTVVSIQDLRSSFDFVDRICPPFSKVLNIKNIYYPGQREMIQIHIENQPLIDIFAYKEEDLKPTDILSYRIQCGEYNTIIPILHYYKIMFAKVEIVNSAIDLILRGTLNKYTTLKQYNSCKKHINDIETCKYSKLFLPLLRSDLQELIHHIKTYLLPSFATADSVPDPTPIDYIPW